MKRINKETMEAREMMRVWKETYMEIREKIELSGKAARWEFDKKKLFGEPDYISSVCKDLNAVVNVIFDFTNIFGDELKSILNDPQKIDAVVRRVEKLVSPIENADFDIFKETSKENWEAIMTYFFKEVKQLEREASYFIDQCFKMLRSAESALEMLLKFKHIQTRTIIQQQLMTKFDVVMDQFLKEIAIVDNIFTVSKF